MSIKFKEDDSMIERLKPLLYQSKSLTVGSMTFDMAIKNFILLEVTRAYEEGLEANWGGDREIQLDQARQDERDLLGKDIKSEILEWGFKDLGQVVDFLAQWFPNLLELKK